MTLLAIDAHVHLWRYQAAELAWITALRVQVDVQVARGTLQAPTASPPTTA